ncbi:SDR family oxidoreductase [Modestobacter versicolor]|uniref:NADP-dependent 3-hydroxy acid dehydrogenase YdfG n=1 Tax=Modestobacter versicolor TaxID=429133 RepID=A0A323VGV5_9ACTN|nr:SDR family oxidoreductase [Modestobacter versicolor]MBB3675974.1 NADP-dependent 3-hydroxy acid dehydrogenase YdfG [Modestobacter versicolor]PZA22376.1 short chain dehydrogenase [Modestobacter versicolor]
MPFPVRQRILITGASAGLGQGMARRFAARGRDLVLVARRLDRLEELRDELLAQHPGTRVVVGQLDVDDPDAVTAVVPQLAGQLGGIDRFIANAGLGKGTPVGSGDPRPNRQVLVTNVLGTHACCEAAVELFRAQRAGHLVVVSSVAGVRGMGGTRTAYATSKAADAVLAEGIRADLLGDRSTRAIRVTTVHPGFIETDINVGRRGPFTVDLQTGVTALVEAIEREPVRAYVPEWPWRPVAGLLRALPLPVVRKLS